MRILKLFVAAAIAAGTIGVTAVTAEPATAQGRHSGEYRHDGDRHDAGRDDNDRDRRDWRNNRGRHHGWRNNRGRHYGWRNRRECRNVWRHGHRQRVCRTVRYRR